MAERRAIVSGAGGVIGLAIARRLMAEGISVGVIDRDRLAMERAASELSASGPKVPGVIADVTDCSALTTAVDELSEALGGVDLVVTAAGMMSMSGARALEAAEFEATLSVNVVGTFLLIQAAVPHLLQGTEPSVVTISSAAGLSPRSITGVAYRVAKAGVVALTRVLAHEFLQDGIRVNCVAPGGVVGGMSSVFEPRQLEAMADGALGHRLASPDEVAAAVAFLQGRDAAYMTGEVLRLAGNVG